MPETKPRRRCMLTIRIQADTREYLEDALLDMVERLAGYGQEAGEAGITADRNYSYSFDLDEDETITHQSWSEALRERMELA